MHPPGHLPGQELTGRVLVVTGLPVLVAGTFLGLSVAGEWIVWAGAPFAAGVAASIFLAALSVWVPRIAVSAAATNLFVAVIGLVFLVVTAVVLLWRIWAEHQSLSWGAPVAALAGAVCWYAGASAVLSGADRVDESRR
jgi:hypothetical protein